MRRGLGLFVLVAVAAGGFAAAIVATGRGANHAVRPARAARSQVTKVTVTGTEFRFRLSRTSVPVGPVLFTFVYYAWRFQLSPKPFPVHARLPERCVVPLPPVTVSV